MTNPTPGLAELKPCPFCGGKADIHQIGNEYTKGRGFEVFCTSWGCSTKKRAMVIRQPIEKARGFAIDRWNQRPAVQGIDAEVARPVTSEDMEAIWHAVQVGAYGVSVRRSGDQPEAHAEATEIAQAVMSYLPAVWAPALPVSAISAGTGRAVQVGAVTCPTCGTAHMACDPCPRCQGLGSGGPKND